MQCVFCPTLKCHLPRYCWHLFLLFLYVQEEYLKCQFFIELFRYIEGEKREGWDHLWCAGSLSSTSNSYLMPTWCHSAPCDEANVFPRWADIVKALERSLGFDWQALSQKMRSGGSRTAKRIYYLGLQGVLSQCVSAVSHLALSVSRIVPHRCNEGAAFKFNFTGYHKWCYWCFFGFFFTRVSYHGELACETKNI